MIANQHLINSLNKAADRIEDGRDYRWLDSSRCNVGILAQELLQVNRDELNKMLFGVGSWTNTSYNYKELPIFSKLISKGLEIEDFRQLEYPNGKNRFEIAKEFRDRANDLQAQID